MKAALYIRVSTSRQALEGDSLAAQRDALEAYAKAHGHGVVGTYVDEGISGQKLEEREELVKMLKDAEAGKVELILFTKLDRFFRSTRHYANTQALLDKWKVQWVAIWENYNTTTPQGQLMVTQLMAFAQFEAQNAGARIRQVFEYKDAQGERLNGSVPFGYRLENKRLAVDPAKAEIVRAAFRRYVEKGSLGEIARDFSPMGMPSSPQGTRELFKKRLYIGERNGKAGYCPAIVDAGLFEEVQRRLSMNVKLSAKRVYLFTGLLRCPSCGLRMRAHASQSGAYYSCAPRKRERCGYTRNHREDRIEAWLRSNVIPAFEKFAFEAKAERERARDVAGEVAALERKIARLKDLYVNELITLEEYRTDKARFESAIASLNESAPLPETDGKALEEVAKRLKDGMGAYYDALGPEDRRSFWRAVLDSVAPDGDGYSVRFAGAR